MDFLALFPKATIQINSKGWWGMTCPMQRQTKWKAQSHCGLRFHPESPQMRKTGIAAKAAVHLQLGRVMTDSTFHLCTTTEISSVLSCFWPSTHQTWSESESISEVKRLKVPFLSIWTLTVGDMWHLMLRTLEHHKLLMQEPLMTWFVWMDTDVRK